MTDQPPGVAASCGHMSTIRRFAVSDGGLDEEFLDMYLSAITAKVRENPDITIWGEDEIQWTIEYYLWKDFVEEKSKRAKELGFPWIGKRPSDELVKSGGDGSLGGWRGPGFPPQHDLSKGYSYQSREPAAGPPVARKGGNSTSTNSAQNKALARQQFSVILHKNPHQGSQKDSLEESLEETLEDSLRDSLKEPQKDDTQLLLHQIEELQQRLQKQEQGQGQGQQAQFKSQARRFNPVSPFPPPPNTSPPRPYEPVLHLPSPKTDVKKNVNFVPTRNEHGPPGVPPAFLPPKLTFHHANNLARSSIPLLGSSQAPSGLPLPRAPRNIQPHQGPPTTLDTNSAIRTPRLNPQPLNPSSSARSTDDFPRYSQSQNERFHHILDRPPLIESATQRPRWGIRANDYSCQKDLVNLFTRNHGPSELRRLFPRIVCRNWNSRRDWWNEGNQAWLLVEPIRPADMEDKRVREECKEAFELLDSWVRSTTTEFLRYGAMNLQTFRNYIGQSQRVNGGKRGREEYGMDGDGKMDLGSGEMAEGSKRLRLESPRGSTGVDLRKREGSRKARRGGHR